MFEIIPRKAIVLTGVTKAGNILVQEFTRRFCEPQGILIISAERLNVAYRSTWFEDATISTKLIVVENVNDPQVIQNCLPFIAGEAIRINRRSAKEIRLQTDLIQFVFLTFLPPETFVVSPSSSRRLNFIDLNPYRTKKAKSNDQPN